MFGLDPTGDRETLAFLHREAARFNVSGWYPDVGPKWSVLEKMYLTNQCILEEVLFSLLGWCIFSESDLGRHRLQGLLDKWGVDQRQKWPIDVLSPDLDSSPIPPRLTRNFSRCQSGIHTPSVTNPVAVLPLIRGWAAPFPATSTALSPSLYTKTIGSEARGLFPMEIRHVEPQGE